MATEMQFHRPIVMGAGGMVSTGHALASGAAVDVLKSGGNAFDAALCASGVLSVVKSYHGGIGGDAFGIFYSTKEKRVFVLNGSGRSPRLLRRERYDEIPERGILAVCTPGLVDAWSEAAARLATRKLGDLLAPAIAYAEEGFPVFPHLRNVIQSNSKTLRGDAVWTKIFLPDGRVPAVGELLVQRDLARTLAAIARGGRDAFYGGEIAGMIVSESQRRGGEFSRADFTEHRSRWEEPLTAEYRGYEVCVPPPNSYGLLLLLQLKLLDQLSAGVASAETVAAQVRAHETAWREGERWIAEPERRAELDEFLKKFPAAPRVKHSPTPAHAGKDTTYIAVADRFGNWASLIQSVHMSFGCGVVVDGTGIVLNNRTPGFNLVAGHPNELAPGKLPAHTLSPALVLKDRKPVLAIGTPGGLGQTQFLAQTLVHIFDSGMNLQQAIEAPRWQSETAGRLEVESRFPAEVSAQLSAAGYEVKIRGPWEFAFGGVEAVARNVNGVFMGAADPRRDGYAIGY